LIALRCPQCGGEIQLESTREIGFCMYCGSKVILQEAINQKVTVDESHKIEAWITLGIEAVKSKNYSEAENYANKIIEADLNNPGGWYIKGCCATTEPTAMQYWYKALEFAKKDTPLWKEIIEALNHPKEHCQVAQQSQKKIRNITFTRNSEFVPSFGKYHIYINGVEKIILAFGQSKTIQLEDGTYHVRGSILGNSINMPLNVNKDTVVCINLNNQERKWEFVTN
jgi:DNA-directed RNA polymerase subunit RPC12/RpoP